MRLLLSVIVAALTVSACGQRQDGAASSSEGCARSATHQVTWSNAGAPDTIVARSEGPACTQAIVTLTARTSGGDPLWVFAATYHDMTSGGAPPEGSPPVSEAEMDGFLASWADVTEMRSSTLPQWRADAATLTESAETFAYETPFDRETYETLRARDLPMVCYAAGAEAARCLIMDPASNTPSLMVAYGP